MKILQKISLLCLLTLAAFFCVPQTVARAADIASEDTASSPEPAQTETPPAEEIPLSELRFDEQSFSPVLVGSEPVLIEVKQFEGLSCQWESQNPYIATVDKNGKVTAVAAGTAILNVTVTDKEDKEYVFEIPLRIVNPHFDLASQNLASGCYGVIEVKDSSGGPVTFSTSNKKLVSYVSDEDGNVKIKAGKKTGTATITVVVDSVTLTCKITVTNPEFKQCYGFYQKNKGFQPILKGINKKSKPQWSSTNEKVATVKQSGCGRTKKIGSALILCRVDGKTLAYNLAVGTNIAVKAMRWGYSKLGKCHYSQARRMNKVYFDCSSFVYRCYRAAGKYLVSKASWAPVAADIGHYYVLKKKRVKPSGKIYKAEKLRPGDLICFGGKKASRNGRYKRIYHIALYIGNGKTMESSSSYNNVVIRDRGIFEKSGVPVIVRPA